MISGRFWESIFKITNITRGQHHETSQITQTALSADGGYVIDWEFGHDNIVTIFERLISAGVDILEVVFG